jgi:WD40 repeat protein/serine/threonine protein kinase
MTSFTCPRGHSWQQPGSDVCPVCGSSADRFPSSVDPEAARPPTERQEAPLSSIAPGSVVTDPALWWPADMPALPQVPGYELLGELGRGGMGVVYKARQLRLNRLVALKMIRPGAHAADSHRSRFRVEAEAAARLQHPNIVSVYEVGEDPQGNPFFSLEFVEGRALDKVLARTPQPPREAAALVETLARAIHYAHEQDIVHRDLKPANVLLAFSDASQKRSSPERFCEASLNDGIPKVADFGLAKQLDESGQTQSGAILGTPSYMAPEQATGHSRQVGPAADIHALGALLYECLTGRPPFHGATVLDTLEQVRTHEPLPPRRLQPAVPRDLDTICLKCLHKEPRKRYSSALELAEDLRRFQAGKPIQARPTPPWERLLKWARRQPAVAALGVVAVCCILFGVGRIAAGWGQAQQERRKADAATQDFRTSEDLARGAEKEARAATDQLRDDTRRAVLAEDRLEETFAHNAFSQAYKEWEAGNVGRATDLLDACRPDLLRWEWHYLRRLCHVAGLTIPGSSAVAFAPNSRRLAVAGWGRKVEVWDVDAGRPVAVLTGLPGKVQALAYSRDGRYLAAGGTREGRAPVADPPGAICVFRVGSGQPVCTLAGHTGGVTSLAFSPDGKRLASAGKDGVVRVWDIPEGKEVFTCKGHTQALYAVAYSSDGRFLASGGDDKTVRLWDPASGRPLRVLPHTSAVKALAFRPDGKRLVAASFRYVYDWDPESGRRLRVFVGHERCWIRAVAFRPAIAGLPWRLAASSEDGTVRSWDYDDGRHTEFRRGHAGAVVALAFSSDGARLATAGRDSLVKLWDTARDGACRVVPSGQGQVSAVAAGISPRHGRIATAGADGTIMIRDAAGRHLDTLRGHTHMVLTVAFSPDGRHLVSGSADHTVRVWDLATSKTVLTYRGHTGDVWSVAFNPDGKRIASASWGQGSCVKVWDAASGKEVRTLEGQRTVAFSPDGRYLASLYLTQDEASAEIRPEVRVWEAGTGRLARTFVFREGSLNSVVFTPDSRRLVAAGGNTNKYLSLAAWDLASGRQLFVTRRSGRWAMAAALSPDGQRLATANGDASVGLFELATGRELLRLRGHTKAVTGVCFSGDGQRIFTVSTDGDLRIWDGSPDVGPHTLRGHADAILSSCVSRDGAWIASASVDTTVRLWDVSRRRLARTLRGHTGTVTDVAFSPDNRRLASAGYEGTVRIWDLRQGGEAAAVIYRGHRASVRSVCFSPDGKRIASGDTAGVVRVWDAQTGADLFSLPKRHSQVLQVAFSPDGRLLAVAGGPEGLITLWDAVGGGLRGSLEGHAAKSINRLAFSPDSRLLASAGGDQTVRVWDVVSRRERLCYRGHRASVYGVCFSPDGKRICSAAEGLLRIWDAQTGADIRSLAGHRYYISCVSFTPDGQLVSGSYDTTLKLWPREAGLAIRK